MHTSASYLEGAGRREPPAQWQAYLGNRRRLLVFSGVFLVSCTVTLAYTFLRPAEYRAAARLQITPPSVVPPSDEEGGGQNSLPFLTEIQVLTSRPIIEKAAVRLRTGGYLPNALGADPADTLQGMLSATPIEGTQLVQLQADGEQRELLPRLVNTVAEVYRENLASAYQSTSANARDQLREEVRTLGEKVAAKREAVDAFRTRFDIVSMERDENQVLAKVKGLAASLNDANDRVASAEGRLQALKNSIATGQAVVRSRDDPTIADMEQRASQVREDLRDIQRRFTEEYLALDPQAKSLRNRLEDLQQQIKSRRESSQKAALTEAQEELASVREAARRLQQQLGADKHSVQAFTARFNEYKAQSEELGQLEGVQRAAQERLAKLEASERARTPQLQIIERATTPQAPTRPLYARDAAISVAGSLLLGLFAMWLVELFNRSEPQSALLVPQPWMPLPFARDPGLRAALPGAGLARLPAAMAPPRELTDAEIAALLRSASDDARLALMLMLSGLSTAEVSALRSEHLGAGTIRIAGAAPRTLSIGGLLSDMLAASEATQAGMPLLHSLAGTALTEDNLDALVTCSAYDAGLERADEIVPRALRHTYVTFLVRQGMRFADIAQIVGRLPAEELAVYAALATPAPRIALEHAETILPALRNKRTASG